MSEAAVRRHWPHINAGIRAAQALEMREHHLSLGGTISEQIESVKGQALAYMRAAEAGGDLRLALLAMREMYRGLELAAKLSGEISDGGDHRSLVVIYNGESGPPPAEWIEEQFEAQPKSQRGGVVMLPDNGREYPKTAVLLPAKDSEKD